MIDFIEESVETGSFRIRKNEKTKLVSHLGSCVGVILVDQNAGLGGMYHILVPEPISESKQYDSYNYASIGLPEFIEQFYKKGAAKENSYAVVAGGALLGQISQRDLDLDIGGRTSEIVTNILNREGITIKESITGGYFGTRMELNLSTMDHSIQSIGETEMSREKYIEQSQEIDIDTAISRTRPIPQIALKVIRMINSSEYSFAKIAMEIRNDQVIGAKVIQLCNSTFSGLSRKINSIDQGLVLLGEKALLKMVLQSSVELYFQDIGKGYSLTKGGMYFHAKAAARVSEFIAQKTGAVKPDVAYTAGLLHDIGKVVLDQYIAQVFPTFFDRVVNEKIDLLEVEENLIGINHTQTGKRLAVLWSIPDIIQDAIEYHHFPENSILHPNIAHIVYFADLILSRYHVGQEFERMNTENFNQRLKAVRLSVKKFTELIDTLPWKEINSLR